MEPQWVRGKILIKKTYGQEMAGSRQFFFKLDRNSKGTATGVEHRRQVAKLSKSRLESSTFCALASS
jgi:hypothetical protein